MRSSLGCWDRWIGPPNVLDSAAIPSTGGLVPSAVETPFRVEYAEVCGELAKGEGPGDRPVSDISVLAESALGEAARFQPKNDETLPPGVIGFFESFAASDFAEFAESTRRGGGLEPGLSAMVSVTSVMLLVSTALICSPSRWNATGSDCGSATVEGVGSEVGEMGF